MGWFFLGLAIGIALGGFAAHIYDENVKPKV